VASTGQHSWNDGPWGCHQTIASPCTKHATVGEYRRGRQGKTNCENVWEVGENTEDTVVDSSYGDIGKVSLGMGETTVLVFSNDKLTERYKNV
jgi:hypothetical protein